MKYLKEDAKHEKKFQLLEDLAKALDISISIISNQIHITIDNHEYVLMDNESRDYCTEFPRVFDSEKMLLCSD